MKEKLKKVGNLLFICLVLVTAGILFQNQDAQAATKIGSYKVSDSKPTKKYDVTGDGKADKIEIKKLNKTKSGVFNYYHGYKILVNGKTVLNNTTADYFCLDVFFIKTKKYNYFKITEWYEDKVSATTDIIYKYSGKRLKKCVDLRNMEKKYEGWVFKYNISSVKSDSIKIKTDGQTGMLGSTNSSFELKVGKNGKLTLAKKVTGISCKIWSNDHYITPKYLTTTKKIQVYKNEGTTKKAFSIKKGSKVKITKVSIRKKKPTYYCVTKSGKKGWIKSGFQLFENLAYAQ